MIPKIIHYCWFGKNPLPELAVKCIESWKKYCPDYEIIEWNEDNFDVSCCDFVKEAYQLKKWAFVSDFARFKILYDNGGIYFDTDVELIKPIDHIIADGPFMGCEIERVNKRKKDIFVAPGLGMGAEKGMDIYREMIDIYKNSHFINSDGSFNKKTVVSYTTELLMKNGCENKDAVQNICGINLYPCDYFCPMNYVTRKINITDNTVSIHHYDGSWLTAEDRYYDALSFKVKIPGWSYAAKFIAAMKFRGIKTAVHELTAWMKRK